MGDGEAEHHAVLVMLGDVAVRFGGARERPGAAFTRIGAAVRHNFAAALAFKRLAVGG